MVSNLKKPNTGLATPSERVDRWGKTLRSPSLIAFFLFVSTVLVFLPLRHHEFVNYDDPDYVTANPHVQSGLSLANLRWAFTSGHASNWHPLTWISHMIDCQLFQQKAGWHHLMSVGIHGVNAALLFLLLNRLTSATARSVFVAAIFALHPLHVESVAWVSERKDVLSGLFFLLTLLAYCSYAKVSVENAASGTRRRVRYGVALVLFALGLMSKPMLVTLPFVLLLLDFWPLRRVSYQSWDARSPSPRPSPSSYVKSTSEDRPGRGRANCSPWGGVQAEAETAKEGVAKFGSASLLLEKIPFFALSAASSIITFYVQRTGGAVSTSLTIGQRLSNAVVAYCRYLLKMILPVDLAVLYPHPGHWPAGQILLSLIVFMGVTGIVVFYCQRLPYLFTGWFWFLGMLIPAIGIVQVGVQSMADRYSYLPLIGIFIALTWGISEATAPWRWRRYVLPIGGAASILICIGVTERQIPYWHDSERLFRHAVKVTTGNYLAYNNLGFYLSNRGKVDEAMEDYRRALEINPAYEDAQNNLGFALAGQKKYAEAISHYLAALAVRRDHVEVHNNLGNALADTGQLDQAIMHYQIVLKQNPKHADAHNNLGIALAMKGNLDEAIPHFYAAIRYKPDYASAHSNLGNALALKKDLLGAIREYEACLRSNPKDAQAHNNLANALAELKRLPEAVQNYEAALNLSPVNPEAHYNLGLVLLQDGKREDARNHLLKAIEQKPDYTDARKQLEMLDQPAKVP